jgi:hypothetical protein
LTLDKQVHQMFRLIGTTTLRVSQSSTSGNTIMPTFKKPAPGTGSIVASHLRRVCVSWALLTPLICVAQPTFPTFPGDPHPIDPGVMVTRVTHIDAATIAPAQVLVDALAAGRNVTLCNVDINMSGFAEIALESGQAIRARAGCERSTTSRGPRIYVTDKRARGTPLFAIRDSNVVLSGFRLEGPNPEIGTGTADREYGIQVSPNDDSKPTTASNPDGAPRHLLHGVRIANMEIFHWSGAGIDLKDTQAVHPQGRMTLASAAGVLIEGNYIHHNRHYDGFGYGVNVGRGAYALVRTNVFEQNRHAIAGDSVSDDKRDFSGYLFQDNLILPGGGLHCREGWVEVCWRTHQIDMHGTKDDPLGGSKCCGTAGETMLIERNTILYRGGPRAVGVGPLSKEVWESGLAIKIRGNPLGRVLVDGNVFAHGSKGAAIAQNGDGLRQNADGQWVPSITNPVQVTKNNRWRAKPLQKLKQCDFDGDGVNDDFMATGVTWWLRPAATRQWRYLSTKTEQIGALTLRDMDGDGKCDVVRVKRQGLQEDYSRGGMGPWQRQGTVIGLLSPR